jgi:hypothetical protein
MRRAPAILAALALAACSVDVEGAHCRVPGKAEDCPSGQACGNDRRCSERALACESAGTRCEPGTALCAGETGKERVERCSADADPACGAWVTEECVAAGLECGTRSASAACECPVHLGDTLVADPAAGSHVGAAPFPTGAPTPAACRFRRLGDALAAAAGLAQGGLLPLVQAAGDAGVPIVFGDAATGEVFPLTVAGNVTLAGAPTPAGPTIIRAEAETTFPLVSLQGEIEDLRVESVPVDLPEGGSLGATGTGIVTACPAAGAPRIEDVTVDGGGSLTTGIDVAGGACGAMLIGVEVSGIDGPALSTVGDPLAASRMIVTNGTFTDSRTGIVASGGKLTIGSVEGSSVEVTGNAGEGIVITGGISRTLDVELLGTRVAENGGTGVVLDFVKPDSSLALRGCTVYANGDVSARSYGPAPQRVAGGVLIRQESMSGFAFEGNRLSSNAADQLGFETSGGWSIVPSTHLCGTASNLFACVEDGYAAIGVAGTGTVDASHSVWPGTPWDGYASDGVYVTPASAYCIGGTNGAPVLPATCPAP